MTAEADSMLETLKDRDRGLYAACLYLPADKRNPVAALHVYELETRRIRDLVSEPMPGEIRLQWWRDVFAGMRDGEARANPLSAGLMDAVARYNLDPVLLERLADARIFDLYDDPMPSVEDLESYCGQTFSTVLQMAATVLGEGSPPPAGNAAGHAGCAMGIAWVLTALPLHRRRGQVFVPGDILAATGLDREALLGDPDKAAVTAMTDALVTLGEDHLAKALEHVGQLDTSLRPALLPLAQTRMVLTAARKAGAGLLTDPVTVSPLRLQWRLFRLASKL